MADNTLRVVVKDRNKVLYDGGATSLSSKNSKGVFDILHNHANFISLINETLLIKKPDGTSQEIPMNNAIIKAKENVIEIYVGVKK